MKNLLFIYFYIIYFFKLSLFHSFFSLLFISFSFCNVFVLFSFTRSLIPSFQTDRWMNKNWTSPRTGFLFWKVISPFFCVELPCLKCQCWCGCVCVIWLNWSVSHPLYLHSLEVSGLVCGTTVQINRVCYSPMRLYMVYICWRWQRWDPQGVSGGLESSSWRGAEQVSLRHPGSSPSLRSFPSSHFMFQGRTLRNVNQLQPN